MKHNRIKLLLPLLLCIATLSASAHDFEMDGIYYNITSSTDLTVEVTYKGSFGTEYSNEYSGQVTIPETVAYNANTYRVTSIGSSAFSGCSSLTAVTIPNSVTSIGYQAFYGCSGLTSVHISDVAAWCKISFSSNYYSNPLYYAHHLYLGKNEIKDLVIPNSVTSIGEYAFSGCSGLTAVTIPNSVTSIGKGAFYNCSGLTAVTIPGSVTSMGRYAFNGTGWYNNIPNGILYLDNWLIGYKGEKPTGTIEIAEGTKGIVGGAFDGCSGLTSVTIPNSVTSIGNSAFSGCSSLTSVTIPNSVTSIGNYAFQGCI